MDAADPMLIEQRLAEQAGLMGLRLRFDKVAARVVAALRVDLAAIVPDGEAMVVAITAPIRSPAKTVAAIHDRVRRNPSGEHVTEVVFGNDVRLRWIKAVEPHQPKVIGVVHNRSAHAETLLDLAEAYLAGVRD